jgi:hypothetical protein
VHRHALPGHHRLVDLGVAVLDDSVGGDLGARTNHEHVTDDDLAGGDLDRLSVPDDLGSRGREVQQGADGIVRATACTHLEPVAEEHEGGQDGGGLVEHLAAAGERDGDRVQPSGTDGDRDQDHHVQRPRPQCPPGAVEEDPGRAGHHREREQQAEHVVAQPERRPGGEPEHVAADGRVQEYRNGEHGGDEEPVAHVAGHVGHRHRRVATMAHRVVRRGQHRSVSGCTPVAGIVGGSRFGHRVADVARDGLSGTVQTAVADPVTQVREVGPGRVVGHGGGLGDRVGVDREHPGSSTQGALDH